MTLFLLATATSQATTLEFHANVEAATPAPPSAMHAAHEAAQALPAGIPTMALPNGPTPAAAPAAAPGPVPAAPPAAPAPVSDPVGPNEDAEPTKTDIRLAAPGLETTAASNQRGPIPAPATLEASVTWSPMDTMDELAQELDDAIPQLRASLNGCGLPLSSPCAGGGQGDPSSTGSAAGLNAAPSDPSTDEEPADQEADEPDSAAAPTPEPGHQTHVATDSNTAPATVASGVPTSPWPMGLALMAVALAGLAGAGIAVAASRTRPDPTRAD